MNLKYKTPLIYWIDDDNLTVYEDIHAWCSETYGDHFGWTYDVESIQYMFETEEALSLFLLRWPDLKYWPGW